MGLWLDGKEASSTESDELLKQWNYFGELLLIGNFLQSQVLNMAVSPPQRQKRQAINGIDYNTTYNLVMGDMRAKFLENTLSEVQKEEASLTIRETQNILADYSLEVLGIERGSMTLEETSAVLAEAKASGNMTLTQHALIQGYGVDTQIRLIQNMVRILGLTASDLELTDDQLVQLLALETFAKPEDTTEVRPENETKVPDVLPVNASELPDGLPVLTTEVITDTVPVATISSRSPEALETTPVDSDITVIISSGSFQSKVDESIAVTTTVSVSTIVDIPPENFSTEEAERGFSSSKPIESSKGSTLAPPVEIGTTVEADVTFTSEVSNLLSSSTNSPSTIIPSKDGTFQSSFKLQEPKTNYFEVLPSLDNVTLNCNVIVASKDVAVTLSSSDIQRMGSNDVVNCLEIFGRIRWPKSKLKSVWRAIKSKVPSFLEGNIRSLKRFEMLQLQNILPAVAGENPELLDMNRINLDGISFLGRSFSEDDPTVLVQEYIAINNVSATHSFTSVEAASLGNLLCGLTDDQWPQLISFDTFSSILTEHLAFLDCQVSENTASFLSDMLVRLYGHPSEWTSSDLLSSGFIASLLSLEQLSQIKPITMEGFVGLAVKWLSSVKLASLSEDQLEMLSPHAASFLPRDEASLPTAVSMRRAIRSVVGEDEILVQNLKLMDVSDEPTVPTTQETPSGVPSMGLCQSLVLFVIFIKWYCY